MMHIGDTMIDLKELRSIAEEHGVELEIAPHQYQPMIVLSVRKDNAVVSSELGTDLFRERADDGRMWASIILEKMIERLEEFLDGRTEKPGRQ